MGTLLYNGEIDLEFNEKKHAYMVGGEAVVSVTQALSCIDKPALIPWAVKMGSEFARSFLVPGQPLNPEQIEALCDGIKSAHRKKVTGAANIGSIVHDFAEKHMRGEHPEWPEDPKARKAAEGFIAWQETHDVELIHAERKIYSRKHKVAGTCDLVAKIDGKMVVCDYKTSSGCWPEMRAQIAMYQCAFEEELGYKFDGRMLLRFDKETGGFEPHHFGPETYEQHLNFFLAALNLYRALKLEK